MKRALLAMFSKVDTLARLVVRSLPTPRLAEPGHRRLVEIGGGLLDLLTIAGLAAGYADGSQSQPGQDRDH